MINAKNKKITTMDREFKKFFSIDLDNQCQLVYEKQYNYDETKIAVVLSEMEENEGICFESLFFLTLKIYTLWNAAFMLKENNGEEALITKADKIAYNLVKTDSFLQIRNHIEEGYAQEYVKRIASYIIEKCKEVNIEY